MKNVLIPVYTDISEFMLYKENLKNIGEFSQLKQLKKDYSNLSLGINDPIEMIKFSLEMFSYLNHLDQETLKEIYSNNKVVWKKESEINIK